MDDVETFASHINQKWEKLDGLVNNAGGALLTKSPSAFLERNDKKYCSQFIGNHIGPFHLTNLLLPFLRKQMALESSTLARLCTIKQRECNHQGQLLILMTSIAE